MLILQNLAKRINAITSTKYIQTSFNEFVFTYRFTLLTDILSLRTGIYRRHNLLYVLFQLNCLPVKE